jgi:hypothetical protein
MATTREVLRYLIPQGGYVVRGEEFEGIEFLECEPITKEQFEAGFAQYDVWKTEQDAQAAATKAAAEVKLAALGLTIEDLKALGLGGN